MSIKEIKDILNKTYIQKHHQTKVGTNIYFCEFYFEKIDIPSRVIICLGVEKIVVTDLSFCIDYIITEEEEIKKMLSITSFF